MTAEEHPDFYQEQDHLAATHSVIERELKTALGTASLDNFWASPGTIEVFGHKAYETIEKLKKAFPEPYTARVDWQPEGSETETFYIGKHVLVYKDCHVYSWASPMASALYFNSETELEKGVVLLKRTYGIAGRDINLISDDFVHASLHDRLLPTKFTDTLLAKLLGQNRTGQLHDIVATIQNQQFAVIKLPKDQALIIQGSPGSGKTAIALHRVAYLLHNYEKEISNRDILILGPSPLFINYTLKVLPSLGQRRITQNAFDEWILERLDANVEYEDAEHSLERLLNPFTPVAEKAMHLRNARNKASLAMATLLERYVEILHDSILASKDDLVFTYFVRRGTQSRTQTARAEIPLAVIRPVLDGLKQYPFNQRRNLLETQLLPLVIEAIVTKLNRRVAESEQQDIATSMREQIKAYLADWETLNVANAYRRLFRNTELLHKAGLDIFPRWDLELLALDAPKQGTPFRFSDLAALLYFKILLDGEGTTYYSHIVVDEAQDISPLHFKVLNYFSRSKSITILGDLSQSIYGYHGITTWAPLHAALKGAVINEQSIRESYRSTAEITEYANRFLSRIGVDSELLAVPIPRPGPAPSLHGFDDLSDLTVFVINTVADARANSRVSIAVVCKSTADCRDLYNRLIEEGVKDCQILDDRTAKYDGGLTIVPAYLTKGLEFDCVIVTDADDQTYGANDLDARLLYVAFTRAAHLLYIAWIGTASQLINSEVDHIDIEPHLHGWLEPRLMTLEQFATSYRLDSDACVERLAGMGKLGVLDKGNIDEVVAWLLLVKSGAARPQDEVEAANLEPELVQELRKQFDYLTNVADDNMQKSLALVQISYGLLRNHMRPLGLQTTDDYLPLSDQVVLLTRLMRTLRDNDVFMRSGRWTTRQRVMDCVEQARHVFGADLLQLLIEYGIVEQNPGDSRGTQIRVAQQWAEGLLTRSLGKSPPEWDPELTELLPQIRVEVTVNLNREARNG